jgi:hypothetical protein
MQKPTRLSTSQIPSQTQTNANLQPSARRASSAYVLLPSHSTSTTNTLPAELFPPRHPRPILLGRSNVGRHVQRLCLRPSERGARGTDLWFPALLGWLGSDCGYDGRVGEHVANSRWAVSLDVYACAGEVEGSFELCYWVVCSDSMPGIAQFEKIR